MSKNTEPSGKHPKPASFDKKHALHLNPTDENPSGVLSDTENAEAMKHPSTTEQQHQQNQQAEQRLKQQEQQQAERSAFPKGNAQEHQQGNRQR